MRKKTAYDLAWGYKKAQLQIDMPKKAYISLNEELILLI